MDKIIGDSKQNGIPSPENPVNIENETYLIKDGEKIKLEKTGIIGLSEKEKTADEIFEDIKFKKIKETEVEILYQYNENLMGEKIINHILFAKVGKVVFPFGEKLTDSRGIGIDELKAINKKVEEMGWN